MDMENQDVVHPVFNFRSIDLSQKATMPCRSSSQDSSPLPSVSMLSKISSQKGTSKCNLCSFSVTALLQKAISTSPFDRYPLLSESASLKAFHRNETPRLP